MWGKGRMEDDQYAGVRNAKVVLAAAVWDLGKIKGNRDVSVRTVLMQLNT